MTTLRPLGPSVTLTASASLSTPRSSARRASSSKSRLLAMQHLGWLSVDDLFLLGGGLRGVVPRSPPQVLAYFSMTASTSRAESTRYSSPAYFTSVPPYLLYSTTSPTLTSMGTRLVPASSNRPGPTAMTSPSCGFSLAVSGITSPDAVVCSASSGRTTIRSSSGLITTLVAVVTI